MIRRKSIPVLDAVLVIVLVLFALMILYPMTGQARQHSKATVCMVNSRLMTRAWLAYAGDNDDKLIGSSAYNTTGYQTQYYPTQAPTTTRLMWNFVGRPHDENGNARNDVLEDEIRGFQVGGLWSYIENPKVYHCPEDQRFLGPPINSYIMQQGWGEKGGYRTYSLGAVLNGYMSAETGRNTGEYLVTVYKTSEIINPAQKIVFIEETDSYGYNGNTWNMFLNYRSTWGDPFAVLHHDKSTLSFADGHTELHGWLEESTFKMATYNVKEYMIPADEPQDYDWFKRAYIPTKIPPELQI
ncbi:MAG: hypothetical protein JXA82_19960 [Sedimentisphaerales bacterium]|nr:hypothetical protein [Sedimentisphaerales bacterium]